MATHISEAEAARDFMGLLARVRAGEEIIIEAESLPIAVLRQPLEEQRPRLLSESIALATQHAEELGYEPVMDEDFAKDMEEVIRLREHRTAAWPRPRSIEECLAIAKRHEQETGIAPVLDPDFAADIEEVIRNRKPWQPPVCD